MVSASLGGPFGACARDEQAPSVPGPSGGSAAMPFVFLSSIEPHAGGRAGTSQVFLLDAEERLQVSSESTDGLLFLLEDARLSQGTFRDVLARSSDLPPASSPARMQDHSPARVAVGRLDPSGTYDMRSFAAREQPAGLAALAEHLRLLREGAQLVRSRPGLYVRAQRIPTFDARVQPPDLVLDDEAARRTPVLAELLKQEMRLVRVGDSGTSVPLGESLEFRSGRAMHVQVGSRVYRLLAYSTVPNPEGEEK
jgi:hypothetical protein